MGVERNPTTRVTLLLRLRDPADAAAWAEFVRRYGPLLFGWCRRHRLQDADAADVTQEVLGKLLLGLRQFDYDPVRGRFRAWLRTVTRHAIHDLVEVRRRRDMASLDAGALQWLEDLRSSDALEELTEALAAEARDEMLAWAHEQVQMRVKPTTWLAYWRTAVADEDTVVVARDLGVKVGDVYVARSRVLKMLREQVAPWLDENRE